ncbi:haloacid dehalogenase superfamily, subfamily IA, variant 3 with third motif having DD or ED [Halogranum gelatinilyticum]|uniref:Haloacid dehalogenase superfamily, subfamily IA, variant 3 with third motif having DD or ED n=1 Tax=Halogranum gelatinilyticum TaxID=660521 RepID=A0A1G9NNY7_9EURY|nr:HAD family phosphatase [Halogranum gelatinilyticum]SDL88074.1 haloacid dehalogenase superfamily, subfamily IA, variant 3 with third motif having DD or ED [Halogranum gelatinilyticum]
MTDQPPVLFDMDGVIVDSETYWHAFEEETLFPETLAGDHPDLDEVTGMNYREIYDYLETNYEPTITKTEFIELYNETATKIYGEQVALMDGFDALTDTLRDRGAKLAIVSSAPKSWIETTVDRFSLGPFDLVLSAEDIDAPGKPEPHIYEHAASEIDADPADCIVVEDSENGVTSASRAGAYVVGYRTGPNAETDLSLADVVVNGPEELRAELLD